LLWIDFLSLSTNPKMCERIFFFKLNGETRKVSAPFLDCLSDLVPLLSNKYPDSDISQDEQFWTIDEQHGVRFQVTSPEEIYNGAVLEVVTQKEQTAQDISNEGRERLDPHGEERGGYDVFGPGSFDKNPMLFQEGEPFNGKFQGRGGFGKPNMETCATHEKQRTMQNLTEQEDGTWICNENSQCKVKGAVRERSEGEEMCSIHGKLRTLQNLARNWEGNWACTGGSRCKVAAPVMRGFGFGRRGGYGRFRGSGGFFRGMGPPRGWRGFRRGNNRRGAPQGLRCSEHGKNRSKANLRSDDCGGWVCLPNSQCK